MCTTAGESVLAVWVVRVGRLGVVRVNCLAVVRVDRLVARVGRLG